MSFYMVCFLVVKRLVCGIVVCGLMVLSTGMVLAGPRGAVGDLYVASPYANTIVEVDPVTGLVVGDFIIGLSCPHEVRFGPNGNAFVVNANNSTVTEHDGETGAFIRVFASAGMLAPTGIRFKANGDLLVYNDTLQNITEYDTNGALIGTFASGLVGGLAALDFGADGNLYFSNLLTGSIDRFTPGGVSLGAFTSGGDLGNPEQHTFGPNGNLFVVGYGSNTVAEYDGTTGVYIRTVVDTHLVEPVGLAFSPDGHLWVSNGFSNDVNEFDVTTGAWIRQVLGFVVPRAITVKPGPTHCLDMVVSRLIAGQDGGWEVRGMVPGSRVVVVYGFAAGSTVVRNLAGFCATFGIQGVNQNRVVGSAVADGSGFVSIVKKIPGIANGLTILTQAAEGGTCPDECVSNVDRQVVQ